MSSNKYRKPHQGLAECRRRLRQVKHGQLAGKVRARRIAGRTRPAMDFVSEDARYAAYGFVRV